MADNDMPYFTNEYVQTSRIIYTPSSFARSSLLYLQEVGTLTALQAHVSERSDLKSFLFFTVLEGKGTVDYEGKTHELFPGDCVFLDCNRKYSHRSSETDLWTLKWVHFYGLSLASVYDKYRSRGGQNVFLHKSGRLNPQNNVYTNLIDVIYNTANGSSYIRDMEIGQRLMELLTLLMAETVVEKCCLSTVKEPFRKKKMDVRDVKEYLDRHYTDKISLDELAERFFINKYYLSKVFKEQYGTTVKGYIQQLRLTMAKSLLRFSDKSIEEISYECGVKDASYLGRIFRNSEGMSPGEYRRRW